MARRTVLTSRQRSALFSLPQHETELLRHYTLSDEDLQHIEARRRPRNKLGFALQLCVLRYPGRLLAPGEFVPPAVVDFIGRQLDLDGYELADYAVRSETRHEHLAELRRLYGFRPFSGRAARELNDWRRESEAVGTAPESSASEGVSTRPARSGHPHIHSADTGRLRSNRAVGPGRVRCAHALPWLSEESGRYPTCRAAGRRGVPPDAPLDFAPAALQAWPSTRATFRPLTRARRPLRLVAVYRISGGLRWSCPRTQLRNSFD